MRGRQASEVTSSENAAIAAAGHDTFNAPLMHWDAGTRPPPSGRLRLADAGALATAARVFSTPHGAPAAPAGAWEQDILDLPEPDEGPLDQPERGPADRLERSDGLALSAVAADDVAGAGFDHAAWSADLEALLRRAVETKAPAAGSATARTAAPAVLPQRPLSGAPGDAPTMSVREALIALHGTRQSTLRPFAMACFAVLVMAGAVGWAAYGLSSPQIHAWTRPAQDMLAFIHDMIGK